MDKLSIQTLFPSSRISNSNRPLSIRSLFSKQPEPKTVRQTKDKKHFNVNDLIETQDTINRQIKDTYNEIYDRCLDRIENANRMKRVDLIFEIPMTVFGNPIFDIHECAELIINKLRDNYIDAMLYTDRHIFITWANIRVNKKYQELENERKEKKKKKEDDK